MTEFSGHLDEACCSHCHVAIDDDGTCPECGWMSPKVGE